MKPVRETTLLIIVAMVCWSAMAIGGVDDSKLTSFSGAVAAIVIAYLFILGDFYRRDDD